MRVELVDPRRDPSWLALVESRPSSVFHSPAWLGVLQDTYGFELFAPVLLDDNDMPMAGLPVCRVEDFLGARLISLPFSDYCDPLVSTDHQWERLVEPLIGESCPVTTRCVHNQIPLADDRFGLMKEARWHSLDITKSLEALWQGLDGAARRAIRKAQGQGMEIREAKSAVEMRAFFDMHLAVRKHKYRLLAQPRAFFEQIWLHFVMPGQGFLLVATVNDRIVAGCLFLQWQQTLYYKFNASVPDLLPERPNDLLIWEGIRRGQARGCTALDFGLSDYDQEGLLRFKRKYADSEKTISFLQTRAPTAPAAAPGRDLLGELVRIFTDDSVPDSITEAAGDLLYRYFA